MVLGVGAFNIWISGYIIQPLTCWYIHVNVAEWWKSCSLCLYSLCEEGVGVSSSCNTRGSWGTWNGTTPQKDLHWGWEIGSEGGAIPWDGHQIHEMPWDWSARFQTGLWPWLWLRLGNLGGHKRKDGAWAMETTGKNSEGTESERNLRCKLSFQNHRY